MEKYSFEEYKLMYQSAEKVSDRRISNNKTNYSICIGILAATAIIWKWAIDKPNYFFAGTFLVLLLSLFAAIFCYLWLKQIIDFKKLNAAKFKVIIEMASNLKFDNTYDKSVDIKSYDPFNKEWEILQQENALQSKPTKNNILGLKSTSTELFLPVAFRIIFIIIFILSLTTICFNFPETLESFKALIRI